MHIWMGTQLHTRMHTLTFTLAAGYVRNKNHMFETNARGVMLALLMC